MSTENKKVYLVTYDNGEESYFAADNISYALIMASEYSVVINIRECTFTINI